MRAFESFTTARLRAERLVPGHLAELERFHRDAIVMAELGGVRDRAQTLEYLARNLRHWSQFGFGVWVLRPIDGTEFAGRAVLRHLDVEGVDEVEVGFAFYPKFWGRGLATEVGEACIALARDDLRLRTLVGVTTLLNHASQRVLAKLGLHLEREVTVDDSRYCLYRVRWAPAGPS